MTSGGQLDGETMYTGYNSAAIYVGRAFNDPDRDSTNIANDVLIRNNRIERVDKAGIIVFDGRKDVIVRANTLENLGGDGIFVNGTNEGLIEHNIVRRSCLRSGDPDLEGSEDFWPHTAGIWIQDAYRTVMQYNEVYDTGRQPGNGDGFAYDFDFGCRECVLQYNYSKNNHGLLLIMNRVTDSIARYNISHNDQTHLVQLHGTIDEGNVIHNNLFYVDHSTVNIDHYLGGDPGDGNREALGATFKNNIFYANGQGRFNTVYSYGSSWERKFIDAPNISKPFSNNLYFGSWLNGLPEDPEKVVADPMFMAPGTGGDGFSTLDGYMLQRQSPAINTGTADLPELPTKVTKDFYGNPVNDGTPDIGVYEQVGSKVSQ
ncbi:right-handed parallel beta-helix repeat-containing protein [Aliifodinibius sp. S!AR15-10]|uniref:right-handed parallel beta-helix repeat-containing protein n=1 Tax=Aliifodinibius sp. S!AR15-10 TaxID=2950437 RepID=UPI00285E07E6|nr:right-handed parallel beta-helix repeat-containing protein [Aliifodinibius sp. S!AR15-10]MDR8394538.1 right-handed parallel beta-helix repeat-containing protein [Aliifodinibius sp. S!AR15-10]